MLKLFRRVGILSALVTVIVCVVLLLNFTAPNPTGRRYSSATVLTTGSATEIGLSGERILAADLRQPRNEDPDQLQCFCNRNVTPALSDCRSCAVFAQLASDTFRRPDFVAPGFIAESKNRQNLLYTYSDQVEQIGDYVVGARALGRPLWLYTRVNTVLAPEFYRMVESTGGGVIQYFTVPGYVDPVDFAAQRVLWGALALLGVMALWELLARQRWSRRKPAPRPSSARRAVSNAESFADEAAARARLDIDAEESRPQD